MSSAGTWNFPIVFSVVGDGEFQNDRARSGLVCATHDVTYVCCDGCMRSCDDCPRRQP